MSPTRVHSGGKSGGKTASPSTARAINDRLALALLQREGRLTVSQLKQLTGLSRPTVADLVERLSGARLITVVGEAGAERRGPNARLYGIVADRAHLAGIDVRTDRVTVCVADLLGCTLAEASLPIAPRAGGEPGRPAAGPPAVAAAVDLLTSTVARAGATSPHTIGVGAPGLLDPVTGALGSNTGWLPRWHADLVAAVRERFPADLLLENEANLAAVAEQRLGAARDRDTFVLLWLGGGTGAAVVLDGALRRGRPAARGRSGSCRSRAPAGCPARAAATGASTRSPAAPPCATSRTDTAWPSRARASRRPSALRAAVTAVRESRGERDERGERGEGGGARVPAGAAEAFLDAYADWAAIGVTAVSAVLDPGCVVNGCECGRAGGDELARRVAERVARMAPVRTEVRAGTVGGAAVLRGAVLIARDAAQGALFAPEA